MAVLGMRARLENPTEFHPISNQPTATPASAPAITDRACASNVGLALAARSPARPVAHAIAPLLCLMSAITRRFSGTYT